MTTTPDASREFTADRPESCSAVWDREPTAAWGTASPATFWVALEQPGPWGAKAFRESRLDPEVGGRLEKETMAAGGRALLIRAVGDHRDDAAGAPRRVYLAGGMAAGRPWLLEGLIDDPAALLELSWPVLAAGGPDAVAAAQALLPGLRACPEPILLVCTNGKRDTCCAVRGRKVSTYAAGQRGGHVWECTHTGGHRFAPTGLVLPLGATFARLDGPLAVASLDAARSGALATGVIGDRHLRGLAHLNGPAQAADAWVRASWNEPDATALSVAEVAAEPDAGATHGADGTSVYDVAHRDGRTCRVLVTATTVEGPPVSCGGKRVESTSYEVAPA